MDHPKDLIFYYKKNKLDKYLGDFIVKHYKKDNPELQAMWNSDTERLNYFIRELYNIKNNQIELKDTNENQKIDIQWIVDRKGLKMTRGYSEHKCSHLQNILSILYWIILVN